MEDPLFYNQPLATRFGYELIAAIESGTWTKLDIAVAWIRGSGMAHLSPPLKKFLGQGGELSTVVGVDLDNTSSEGLRALLDVGAGYKSSAYVHHNESGTIFHPKLYLFRNAVSARLIIGSSNITEAGLFRNTEAALQLDLKLSDPILISTLHALDAWRDVTTGLAHQLDEALIQALEKNSYIKSEAALRLEQASRSSASKRASGQLSKLFKSIPVSAPARAAPSPKKPAAKPPKNSATKPSGAPSANVTPLPNSSIGQVLLMRVRKAHATDRPTQTQIPSAVRNSSFFNGAMSVISAHDRQVHAVTIATARGGINTLKLEIPEMRYMNDPVVRFDRTTAGIQYEVYDSSSPQGKTVMTALQNGRVAGVANPTTLTRPSDPAISTWWRFI
jgi:HKD family nuclease